MKQNLMYLQNLILFLMNFVLKYLMLEFKNKQTTFSSTSKLFYFEKKNDFLIDFYIY